MKGIPIQPGLIGFILRKPVTVLMITILVIGSGLFAMSQLRTNLMPSMDIPVVAIQVGYSNVAPDDMVDMVVRPIEGAIASIEGVETMDANSSRGSAFIILRLQDGVSPRKVEMDIRAEIDRIRDQLPADATEPRIFQFDPDSRPIMQLSVSSEARGLDQIRNLTMERIEPRLERLEGVAAADTRGGFDRNIYIDLDRFAMAQHNVVPSELTQAMNANNSQVPVGNLAVDRVSYNVLAKSMFQSVQDIRDTIIRIDDEGRPIRVSHVADVEDGYEDITTLVEVNGNSSVTLEIQKQSDANTLEVAHAVLAEIPEIEASLPAGFSIRVLSNDGENIEQSLQTLSTTALQALALVVLMLFIFLGGWRSSTVVAFSIPISITATFTAMYFTGITLNIISITGLALAIGLLVDNSIVVLDAIVGKLEKGLSVFQAALEGTNEVKGALTGATLTTLGVFIPILGIGGMTGQVFRDLALTICLAISISLIVSILLIPVFSSRLVKKSTFEKPSIPLRILAYLEARYIVALRWVLTHKYMALLAILGIFGGTWFIMQNIETDFFPQQDTGEINVTVELPLGSNLVSTTETMRDVSRRMLDFDEVETVITNIGQSGRNQQANSGRINVTLVPEAEREASTSEVALQMRRSLDTDDNVDLNISPVGGGFRGGGGGWGGGDIRLTLFGSDSDVLKDYTNRIEHVMMQDTSVISVDNPRVRGTPELQYHIDRRQVNRLGSSLNEVANALGSQVRGSQAGDFRTGGREIPIQVRMDETYLAGRHDLQYLDLIQHEDQRIPVTTLGSFQQTEGLSRISRRDRETMLDVNISVEGNPAEHRERIMNLFQDEIILEDGYRYEFTGMAAEEAEGLRELLIAVLLAIALTYMVMAGLFENFRDPLVIMFTIPMAFFGSYAILLITGTPFSVPAGIGMVILIGIAVNNGIVLVDYIHQYTRPTTTHGEYVEQFMRAAKRRFRPIVLTAATTVGSMLPLALQTGIGSETWAPLAISVIGGMIFAAILTLFIIPAVLVGFSGERRAAFNSIR